MLKSLLGIDRALFGLEIAHVTIGGEHLEVAPQVLLEGLRLGRRFDDE